MPADPFIGEVVLFAGNFAPRGWALCEGQLLPIAQNTALYSILGTTYGGDGRSTFGLPDLRGRVPISSGHGPGLTDYRLGQKGGVEEVTLSTAQIPSHAHAASSSLVTNAAVGDSSTPDGNHLATPNDGENNYHSAAGQGSMSVNTTVSNNGGGQAHENRQPYLAMNYIIALVGLFPSRS